MDRRDRLTEPRRIANEVTGVLRALGWTCEATAAQIRAEEPAFHPVEHFFVAGHSSFLVEEEIAGKPEVIVIEDSPPPAAVTRLRSTLEKLDHETELTTQSRFVDRLWGASEAAEAAMHDADSRDDAQLFSGAVPKGGNPQERHADQKVMLGAKVIADIRLLEESFEEGSGIVVLMADAGLGKTELLRVLQWRMAASYLADAENTRSLVRLPSIALKVRLRDQNVLSIDVISRLLHETPKNGGLGLHWPFAGVVLEELCRLRRVVLLLDGLDEFSGSVEALESGLKGLAELAEAGARMVIATRPGRSARIPTSLEEFPTAWVKPLDDPGSSSLLRLYGVADSKVDRVKSLLPREVRGIPLFLLLALATQNTEDLPASSVGSKTSTLLELLDRFCERDWSRIQIPASLQMTMLRELAHWISMFGSVTKAEALDYLKANQDEKESRIVLNPHGLLTLIGDEIAFRHPQFVHVLLVSALWNEWQFHRSIPGDLGELLLSPEAVDHLADLVPDEYLVRAWLSVASGPSRSQQLLRRNLFAVALSKLEERAAAESEERRSKLLEELLGNRDLGDMSFSGLSIERIDFSGWDLRRVRNSEGRFSFCILEDALIDDSILSIEELESNVLPKDDDAEEERIQRGKGVLLKLLHECLNLRVSPPSLKPEIEAVGKDAPDYSHMKALRAERWVDERQGPRGSKFWVWTEKGKELATRFLEDSSLESDELVSLVVKFGSWAGEA